MSRIFKLKYIYANNYGLRPAGHFDSFSWIGVLAIKLPLNGEFIGPNRLGWPTSDNDNEKRISNRSCQLVWLNSRPIWPTPWL